VPLSNHHHGVAEPLCVGLRLLDLLDFDATVYGNPPRFHHQIVVSGLRAAQYRLNMLCRSAQRDCQFARIAIERASAQILDYFPSLGLIGAFVVNLLVKHVKAPSFPLFCSRSLS
jgi:hypothetical protein